MNINPAVRHAKLYLAVAVALIVSASAYAILNVTTSGGPIPFTVTATPSGYFEYHWSSLQGKTFLSPSLTNVNHTSANCIGTGSDAILAQSFNSSHVFIDSGTSPVYNCQ